MKSKALLLVVLILTLSCGMKTKKSHLEFKSYSDSKDIFKLDLPTSWNKKYPSNKLSSSIISKDTSSTEQNTFVVVANWLSETIDINEKLDSTVHSIYEQYGLKTEIERKERVNNFNTYFNYSWRFDSIENTRINQLMYVLKADSNEGHLNFSVTIIGDTIQDQQYEVIERIIKSIEFKK